MKRGLNKENSLPDPEFGGESSESARAIHYVVQKDTLMTYVSARFAQADPGIVSGSTIERKKMSTKTIYKRIALVAVAALGMGVVSSVSPASAVTNTYMWCEVADGLTNGSATDDVCNGVAGAANTVTLQFTAAPANSRVTISGAGATFGASTANGVGSVAATVPTSGLTATHSGTAGDNNSFLTVATPTAGTVIVSLFETLSAGIYKTTATETVTITVNAAAVSGGINTATTTSLLGAGATWPTITADAKILVPATASATPSSVIRVALGQTAGAITGTTKVTASISGPGLIYLNDNNNHTSTIIGSGRSLSSTVGGIGAETFYVLVAPDGNAGVATITITAGTFTSTETVTFYGTAATLTATTLRGSIPDTHDGVATGDTAGYAAVITAKDSAGNAVPVSGFTAVTAAQLTAADITAAGFATATAGTYGGVVLDGSESVVVVDPTATKTGVKSLVITHTATGLTVTVPFTVGLVRATTVTLTTDKATYLPGEKMVLTLTATAGGVPIADATATDLLAAGGITANVSLAGDVTTATNPALVAGKKSWTVFAPLTAGPVVFAAKTGATNTTYAPSAAVVTLAATAAVSDSPSMQAMTTLINSLIAKINALNKLVIKIQKKVRA
jgi:trimeric autotransporter adhesin